MKKNTSIILVLLYTMSSLIFAIDKTGTTAAKFLTIGIGSRPAGLGNAYVAIADDPTAMYWNPAGISRLQGHEVFVNHNNWFADISVDYSGAVVKISDNAAFGANLTILSMEEIEVTRYGNEDTGETYRAGNLAIGLTYARNLTDKFSIGSNLKIIRESIANNHASGFAIDIGTLFDTPFGFKLGTSISNFGPKMKMSGDDLIVPVDINENLEGNNENTTGKISTPKTVSIGGSSSNATTLSPFFADKSSSSLFSISLTRTYSPLGNTSPNPMTSSDILSSNSISFSLRYLTNSFSNISGSSTDSLNVSLSKKSAAA